jgi:hypothetical protein
MREIDGPSLVFICFNVPALTSILNCIETVLLLTEDITLFAICGIYKCQRQRGPEKHLVFGEVVSFIYIPYNVGDRPEPSGTPACISLGMDISLSTETDFFALIGRSSFRPRHSSSG